MSRRLDAARKWAVLPSARGEIDPFIVMDVMRAANAREARGERVIHLEVGQPGTPAPRPAREAAKRAIDSGKLGYTEALGLPELRSRIARHYGETYGIDVDPGRVIVTAGSSAGFVLAFLALFDTGARVALPSPGYPCYRHILKALGCEPQMLETGPRTRWMPDAAMLGNGALDGLLIASPANPTGTMLTPERLEEIVTDCRDRRIAFISDEIYHGLTYGAPAQTALAFSDDVVVINSFSKYFSMTGWRVGWMIVPPGLVRSIERLAQNLYISPTTVSQVAALAALDARAELEGHRRIYAANRELLLGELPKAGFAEILPADGAFYLYASSEHLGSDSAAVAARLLETTGVAVTPGIDFDPARGRSYLRLSYAGTTADMEEAARRLRRIEAA
jgi:aspartate/methionine/tyrosine aminotransferase